MRWQADKKVNFTRLDENLYLANLLGGKENIVERWKLLHDTSTNLFDTYTYILSNIPTEK